MVRELDDLTLTLSLWRQARTELHELERRLHSAGTASSLTRSQLKDLEDGLHAARTKAEQLLDEALLALRKYAADGTAAD